MEKNTGRNLYLVGTGLLLVTSAVAKSYDFHSGGVNGLALEHVVYSAAIVFEFAIGVWCLFFANRHPVPSICFLVGVFILFSTYQMSMLLSGKSNCGCFGAFEVHPGFMFTLDVAIASIGLTFLRLSKPNTKDERNFHTRLSNPATLGAAFVIQAAFTMWFCFGLNEIHISLKPSQIQHNIDDGLVEALKPIISVDSDIEGNEFDWSTFVGPEVSSEIRNGEWIVVFVRTGCKSCDQLLSAFEQRKTPNVVLIHLGEAKNQSALIAGNFQINPSYGWVVTTPFVFKIKKSVVTTILNPETIMEELK